MEIREYFFMPDRGDVAELAASFKEAGHDIIRIIDSGTVGVVPFGNPISDDYFPEWLRSFERHFCCSRVVS